MFEKVDQVVERYNELNRLLSSQEVMSNPSLIAEYGREQSEITPVVESYGVYQARQAELAETRAMLEDEQDPDMREMVEQEVAGLEAEIAAMEEKLTLLLLPTDPRDSRNVIVEIRAGAGGDEAALFAADLFHMYTNYAASQRFKTEVISANEIGIGGYKEIVFRGQGQGRLF